MDTASVLFIIVGGVALAWSITTTARRRLRATRELAARKAAAEQAANAFDPRTLWFDEGRRQRIAANVKAAVSKHHDW